MKDMRKNETAAAEKKKIILKNVAIGFIYLIALFGAFAYVLFAIEGFGIPRSEDWKKALLIAGFIVDTVVFYIFLSFMHELGHLAFAKAYGFSIAGFSFWIVHVDRRAGRKVRFYWDAVAGSTAVYPTEKTDLTGYRRVVGGGLLFSAIVTALFALLFLALPSPKGKPWFSVWTVGLAFTLINLIPYLIPTSDGTLLALLKNENELAAANASLAITRGLAAGRTFSEMEDGLFAVKDASDVFSAPIAYAGYLRLIENGNFKSAESVLATLSDQAVTEDERCREEFFLSLATGRTIDSELRAAAEDVLFADPESPSSLRTLALYAFRNGETERAELLTETMRKREEVWYLPGEARSALKAARIAMRGEKG